MREKKLREARLMTCDDCGTAFPSRDVTPDCPDCGGSECEALDSDDGAMTGILGAPGDDVCGLCGALLPPPWEHNGSRCQSC